MSHNLDPLVPGADESAVFSPAPPAHDGTDGNITRFRKGSRITFDLQLFADDSPTGQKTEEATPLRREQARREGLVARSMDLSGMVTVLFTFLAAYYLGDYMIGIMKNYLGNLYSDPLHKLDPAGLTRLMIQFVANFLMICVPVLACAVFGAFGIGYYQVGLQYTLEPLMFNIGHMNPVNGLSKMISREPAFEMFKSSMKVLLVAYIPYSFFKTNLIQFPKFMGMEIEQILAAAYPLIFDLSIKVIGAMLLMAILDYYYQHSQYERTIMMSKYDLQQEFKMTEGNPLLKQELRRRARAIATGQMMKKVPKAKVVVTNPTHCAVAIDYESGQPAPVVVAKGIDFMAQKIKEIAAEHDIPMVENVPLAWKLYDNTEVDQEIPEELFGAVAEVLAFVWRKAGKKAV